MNTQKIKQLWNCFLRKVWGLPDFLITGSGVESWVRILEEWKRPGKGVQIQGKRRHQFQGGGLNWLHTTILVLLDQIHRNNRGNKTQPNTQINNIHSSVWRRGTPTRWETAWFQKRQKTDGRTSLVVQWLRLQAPNAGGLGLIPGQRTRSRMPWLRLGTAKSITQSYKKKRKQMRNHIQKSQSRTRETSAQLCA